MSNVLVKPHVHVDYSWTGRRYLPGDVDRIMNDPANLVITCWRMRIGINAFLVQLELEYFPPVGPVNDQLHVATMKWPEVNDDPANQWMAVAVPMQYRPIVEHVAQENSMRLANGVPTMIEPDAVGVKTNFFPYKGENVFNLENESGSAIYDNRVKTRQELYDLEFMRVDAIRAEFREKYALYFEALGQRKRSGQTPQPRPAGQPRNRQQRRDEERRKNR